MQDYVAAFQHVAALLQDNPDAWPIDLRFIHDQDKSVPAIKRHGLLRDIWNEALSWQAKGYGVFVNINHMDGSGDHKAPNVVAMRCAVVDLDNINATASYNSATQLQPSPSFAVQSSPGKFHVYWQTAYYQDHQRFTLLQRKMAQFYHGDLGVIDPTRVLRLAGTYHLKASPQLVYMWPLAGFNQPTSVDVLEQVFRPVILSIASGGERKPLGDDSLTAPDWSWCIHALETMNPASMDRNEWRDYSYAWKQAAWLHADENTLLTTWLQWCAQYPENDQGENQKLWSSDGGSTLLGWKSLARMNVKLKHAVAGAEHAQKKAEKEAKNNAPMPAGDVDEPNNDAPSPLPLPFPEAPKGPRKDGAARDRLGAMLVGGECDLWFENPVIVTSIGEVLDQSGRLLNSAKFNAMYGGKQFVIDEVGDKTTNEPWQALTRSQVYQPRRVDHMRFLPKLPPREIVRDAFGREGINTYKPVTVDHEPGDITPFLRHLELLVPDESDRTTLCRFLAHCVQKPGHKIPWAPLIQSAEGAGKGVMKMVITHAIGAPFTYFPKAEELVDGGSKFNAWMRNKLFILVDEIKTGERRELIEILKPLISEEQIEIQGKGKDQDLEDNFTNWMFFSNYKDAIPVNKNSRRYAIFFSPIQSKEDLLARGMNDAYFAGLYAWLRADGKRYVANALLSYPTGEMPMRAPDTSSSHMAVEYSRGPIERMVLECIADNMPGFRGGYVSHLAVLAMIRTQGLGVRGANASTIANVMEMLGYHAIGRSHRPYMAENKDQRANLYHTDRNAPVERFGDVQGYA